MRGRFFLRALAADRSGAITIIGAMAMTASLGCLAFAVDLGSVYFQTRRLQGIADAAALAAVGNLGASSGAARATIAANRWTAPYDLTVDTGAYTPDPALAPAQRFAAGATEPNAARVRIESDAPLFFGIALGRNSIRISRTATAARTDMASFTLGSRLAALDGGVANALLGALTGSKVSLSVMDYNALLGADVDLFAFSSALQTRLHLQAASFDDVLAARMTTGDAMQALAAGLDAGGSGTAAQAVRKLATATPGTDSLALGKLIDLGPIGAQDRAAPGQAIRVNAFDLLRSMLQLANGTRQVQLDLGANVPGLASLTTKLAIGDRPQSSPWLTITDKDAPIVRTAQTRLFIDATVGGGSNPLGASVRLPVYVELAEAEAKLSAIHCATGHGAQSVVLDVQPSIGHAAIADLSPSDIGNHGTAPVEGPARIVSAPLLAVTGQARADLTASGWQSVPFGADDIAAARTKTVSSTTLVQGITVSLVSKMNLSVNVAGLGLNASAVTALVGNALAPAAPQLDGVINALTGLLGIHLGQADVRVNGVRCGVPALVA